MATLAEIREKLVEGWLSESNSDFYTDPILLDGINYAYRRLARAMGGVDARWDQNTTITFPYEHAAPRDLIWPDKFTYNPAGPSGAGVKELFSVTYDEMYVYYGREWVDDAAGTPEVVYRKGWRTFGLYPRAASVITNGVSVFGRGVPANLSGDAAEALTPTTFDDTIGAGAFVYCVRRLAMRDGGRTPPQFQEALGEWSAGLAEAHALARRIPESELIIVGTVPSTRGRLTRLRYDFE